MPTGPLSDSERPDPERERAEEAARRLLPGGRIDSVQRAAGGGNSRIYRVVADGVPMALKLYPRDGRDRLGHERAALLFLGHHGAGSPRLIAADAGANAALLEWIDGVPVHDDAVPDMLAFLRTLHGLRAAPGAAALPEAVEGCLSAAELLRQIVARRERLDALDEAPLVHSLRTRFDPCFAGLQVRLADVCERAGLDPNRPLPLAQRTLSPSDFGGHNALRRRDGGIVFLDFEYFGWDDPVKLTADVLWHPGMRLSAGDRRVFLDGALGLFARDPAFPSRLAAQVGLYGLRWSLIVLSDFLPERWAHRTAAGEGANGIAWADAKRRQLDKAGVLFDRVARMLGAEPKDWPSAFTDDDGCMQ